MKSWKKHFMKMPWLFLFLFLPAVSLAGMSRSYVGGGATSAQVLGDFRGQSLFVSFSNDEFDFVPSLERDFGFWVMAGHREGDWAAEISFWYSKHKAAMGPFSGVSFESEGTYQSVNVDLKRYLLVQNPIQPFLDFGVSFPWIVVKEASFDSGGVIIGNSVFKGLGFNLGGGVEFYVHPKFSVITGVVQRWQGFDKIKGIGGIDLQVQNPSTRREDTLSGDGLQFVVGGAFNF